MPFGSLWLPVIVSAVVVFFASFVLHMVMKYHKADLKPLPDEEGVRAAIAKANPAPGQYFTPYCMDHKVMKDPANMARFEKGPVAILTVMPKGAPKMGKHLGLWFGYSVLVSFTAAYLARHTLAPGAEGIRVMQVVGTTAFAGYGLSHISDSIWKGQPWGNTARALIDGALYAVLTGAVFRMLWPAA